MDDVVNIISCYIVIKSQKYEGFDFVYVIVLIC